MSWPDSEEEWDQVQELKDKISDAVEALVDDMTKDVSSNIDAAVRTQLSEQFRFWRR